MRTDMNNNSEEIKDFRRFAEQFRKLADAADNVVAAYETGNGDNIELALKDFTWEFLKMQKM